MTASAGRLREVNLELGKPTVNRSYLARLKGRGEIRDVIYGEDFSIFNPAVLEAFRRCDGLRKDPDRERHNNGITMILL